MSFLSANRDTMAFELWPTPLRREIRRLKGDHDFVAWELFPYDLQGMTEWAEVYKDEERKDKSRNRILIYKEMQNKDPATVFPVALRIQGLLGEFRVDRFGNWSGNEMDVGRAVQYINISSGGHRAPWDATIDSLNLACEYVSRRLHLQVQGIPFKKDKDLYLQRRAFVKKKPGMRQKEMPMPKNNVTDTTLSRIEKNWSVVHALQVADLSDEGKIVQMNSVLLTERDFVDVGAELNFVISRDRHKDTVLKCFLTCTHIVRMVPSHQMEYMALDDKNNKRKRGKTPPKDERPIKKSYTTLLIDEN